MGDLKSKFRGKTSFLSVSHIDKKALEFSRLLMKNIWIFDSVPFFYGFFSRSEIWLPTFLKPVTYDNACLCNIKARTRLQRIL